MDLAQILVTTIGVVLIALTLWFFFGAREAAAAHVHAEGGPQEIEVVVQGGYTPDRIEVRQDQPVRLTFRREESTDCTEQLVLPDFGLSVQLPQGQRVPVEFTPEKIGEFPFHCGMNMVRGRIVVIPATRA